MPRFGFAPPLHTPLAAFALATGLGVAATHPANALDISYGPQDQNVIR